MRRDSRRPAAAGAILAIILITGGAVAADRPRLRPTPSPAVPSSSSAPASDALASAAPAESWAPSASFEVPPAAGCLGLERSIEPAGPAPSGSASPGPVATTPTPGPDPDATQRIKVPAAGVRLDLPTDWVASQGDDLASLDEVPELTETLAAIEASSLVLLAADVLPGATCDLGGTLSLYDLGGAVDARVLAISAEAIAIGLEELDEVQGDVSVTTAELPVGDAQRLTFRFDATEDGALTAWWVRADAFVASGRTLLAAYAAPQELAADAKPAFNAIARSVRET